MSEKTKTGGKKAVASGKKSKVEAATSKKSTAKKTTARKTAAKKAPAQAPRKATGAALKSDSKKSAATTSAAKPQPGNGLTAEDRWRRIAEGAYLRAEARGFQGGDPTADWLAAEAEVDASLRP